jgi:superfamily I DNA/RNA helicase
MKEAGFRLEEEKVEISNNGVKLLTAHSSKGAEFKMYL